MIKIVLTDGKEIWIQSLYVSEMQRIMPAAGQHVTRVRMRAFGSEGGANYDTLEAPHELAGRINRSLGLRHE